MPSPAPCLLLLQRQVDERWPGRSHSSDGIMGDASHQLRKSDHNEGNALDLTHDPAHGFDAGRLGEAFVRQMRSNPGGRLTYVIWSRRIASPRSGWSWRPYVGPNPHTSHIHLSISASARNVVRPWKLD